MQKKPYSMIPALADRTLVYLFNYAGDPDDFDADKAAFDTELKLHLSVGNSCAENGIAVTGTDLSCVLNVTKQEVKLASATTMTAAQVKHPLIFFKGKAVPYSHFDDTVPPSTVDGLVTLTAAATSAGGYTVDETDYVVYWSDHLSGYLISADVGGVTLPIDSNSFNAVGHEEPVYRVFKRGTAEGTGSLSVVMDLTAHVFGAATAPANWPGEELQKRIYGSEWTTGGGWDGRNPLMAPTNPFGVAVLKLSGKQLSSAEGHVWGVLTCIYHCELTTVSSPQNVSNDSTDPIALNVDFTSRFPDMTDQAAIYTTGP